MDDQFKMWLYQLATLYIIISQLFALYFWYLFSQDNTFLATLVIGPIVGEFKGLLFPFFI
jgi:hypothetical protein